MSAPADAGDLLKTHRWKHRLLLTFYPAAGDPRVQLLERKIADLSCGFEERDLLFGSLPMDGESRFADELIPAESASEIRRRFRVGEEEFAVILVGKDGGSKLRVDEVPELHAVFGLIDGMPMRMAEMREHGRGCSS